ncbi:MAG: DNA repair protein RecN [Myxococcaceae bacterium]
MLLGLRISNFAVIDEVEVGFGSGLTVLTGETGAGKSILVDALSLLLGGRSDGDVVRAGSEEAIVEGTFARTPELAARLEQLGLPDDDELLIRRVVGRGGRGKAYVNGSLVTVGVLSRLMKGSVDIAGQHEHVGLFDPAQHRMLLDKQAELEAELSRYHEHWAALAELGRKMQGLGGDEQQARQRGDFLRYQLEELERLDAQPGEDDLLEAERRKLSGTEKLKRAAVEVESLLSGQDGSALELIHRSVAQLTEATKTDVALLPQLDALRAAAGEVDAIARGIARYGAAMDADPQRLQDVEERLDAIKKLSRKHARALSGLIELRSELKEELTRIEHRKEDLEACQRQKLELEQKAFGVARKLSERRKKAAAQFSAQVRTGLAQLAMAKAVFEVRVESGEVLGPEGLDAVEFYFSANAGEPCRPLSKVASGGEASRVLLSLKRALAGTDGCGCYVLDEADSGVSGAVAEVVGRMIKEVSLHRQVLCITHLPQVAAYADAHLLIKKEQTRGRTYSRVLPLAEGQERTTELARMLSGVELTKEALGAAEALVRSASRVSKASGHDVRRVKSPPAISAREARVKPEKRRLGS